MNEVTIIFWKNTPSTNKITLSHRITGTKGYIYKLGKLVVFVGECKAKYIAPYTWTIFIFYSQW